MPLDSTIEKLPEATAVVTLAGQLTLGMNLKMADSQIQTAVAEGSTRLVIDMTGIDYIDSAGLGMLVFLYGVAREKGGAIRLCGVAPRIASLLQLTKTDGFLAVDADREASLAALKA